MKTSIRKYCQQFGAAGLALFASIGTGMAQNVIVDQFNNATGPAEVAAWVNNPGWGITAPAPTFNAADALGSASSGSITFEWAYTNGGPAGVQFQTTAPATADLARATFVEFDLMVDPASGVDNNGNICSFQGGANGVQTFSFNLGPWGTAFTKGVWQHFKIAIAPGKYSAPGGTFFINPWGGPGWGAISPGTNMVMIVHMDNIVIDIPVPGVPTYPNIMALTFDQSSNVVTSGTTGWYGNPINTYEWTSLDASNNANSGSLHIVADFSPNNNACVAAIPFDPLYPGFSNPTWDTNVVINAQHYANVEMDVKWDTANSTVDLAGFNQVGDISGFPLGLLYNSPGAGCGGQAEAFGTSTTYVPDAASNGWVHMSFPLNQATANIDQCIGLWLKKYQWNGALSGTVAFYIDNVNFIGAPIPQVGPPLTISKPVYGLQQVHTGGSYDREGVVTVNSSYSFVNQPNPTTYTMGIASLPTDGSITARILLVPLQAPTVDGTAAEPDWVYPNVLMASIQRNGAGSSLTLAAKVNQPSSNGSFYDSSAHPTFNSTSSVIGNWSISFTANDAILVTAPDGSYTNLAFPGVAGVNPTGLSSGDVSANFEFGLGMVAYFDSINNATTGTRMVQSNAKITRGSSTLLSDNFVTDTTLDVPGTWLLASGGGATSTYLLAHSIQYFLDWPITFGGYSVQTNSSLTAPGAWNTNSMTPVTLGAEYHVSVDTTNLPPSGNLFFQLKKY